ncbi:ricin-type beta-trefoil lectin domain protein [Streptomyces sp. NPDC002588]|uniref:RICIN domain-containing protein n=1 Tax=Streptomyces sp. NPDC002588 TaxID=3154419 RepID=UPI00332F2D39
MPLRRRLVALVSAVFAVLAIGWAAGAPAQAVGFAPINVWNGNHCLDNATENASKLQMWNCTGGPEQRWLSVDNSQTSLFTFTNQNTGRCITAPSSGTGTVTMAVCDAAATNQQWRVFFADNPLGPPSGWYDVWQNASSGFCLYTTTVANGNLIRTAPCTAASLNQRWHLQ